MWLAEKWQPAHNQLPLVGLIKSFELNWLSFIESREQQVNSLSKAVTRDKNTKSQPATSVLSCWLPSNNTRRQGKKNDNTKSHNFKNTTSFHHWCDTAYLFLKCQTGYCVKKQEALQTRKRPKIRAEKRDGRQRVWRCEMCGNPVFTLMEPTGEK